MVATLQMTFIYKNDVRTKKVNKVLHAGSGMQFSLIVQTVAPGGYDKKTTYLEHRVYCIYSTKIPSYISWCTGICNACRLVLDCIIVVDMKHRH